MINKSQCAKCQKFNLLQMWLHKHISIPLGVFFILIFNIKSEYKDWKYYRYWGKHSNLKLGLNVGNLWPVYDLELYMTLTLLTLWLWPSGLSVRTGFLWADDCRRHRTPVRQRRVQSTDPQTSWKTQQKKINSISFLNDKACGIIIY